MKLTGFGQDDGRDKGLERGREELRNSLAEVFEVRRIRVGDYERMRIYGEDSIERLRAWHRRALTASTATEVVGAAPRHDAVAELVQFEKIMRLGLRQGLDRGREALRAAVLDAFETRGIEVSPLGRKRIEAETSLEQLREWLRRALTAASAADVLCKAWIPDRGRPEPVISSRPSSMPRSCPNRTKSSKGREALRRSLLDLNEARGIPIGDDERARIAAETSFTWLDDTERRQQQHPQQLLHGARCYMAGRSRVDLTRPPSHSIGDDERARIAAETSFAWLRAWIRRALTAMSAAEVVDDTAG